MKKLIIAALLLISVTAFSQKDSIATRDSFPPIPDTVFYISKANIETVKKMIEDNLTVTEYKKFSQGIEIALGTLINVATAEYNKKRKPIKVK